MANTTEIDRHKSILGTLFIVFSLFHLVFIVAGLLFIGALVPTFAENPDDVLVWNIIQYAIITLTLLISVPALVAGIALLYKKNWGLTLAFIIGIISLPAFPIWTFVGIYAIVVFIMAQRQPVAPASGNASP